MINSCISISKSREYVTLSLVSVTAITLIVIAILSHYNVIRGMHEAAKWSFIGVGVFLFLGVTIWVRKEEKNTSQPISQIDEELAKTVSTQILDKIKKTTKKHLVQSDFGKPYPLDPIWKENLNRWYPDSCEIVCQRRHGIVPESNVKLHNDTIYVAIHGIFRERIICTAALVMDMDSPNWFTNNPRGIQPNFGVGRIKISKLKFCYPETKFHQILSKIVAPLTPIFQRQTQDLGSIIVDYENPIERLAEEIKNTFLKLAKNNVDGDMFRADRLAEESEIEGVETCYTQDFLLGIQRFLLV